MGCSRIVDWIDRKFYADVERAWEEQVLRREVLSRLNNNQVILDLGAGSGNRLMDFRGHAAQVCGLDPDPQVLANPFLDEAKVGTGEAIPYEDASFDLVVANNVLEHLARPQAVFREVYRVLKPGGVFVVKTPNRRHYFVGVARLTPHWFHRLYYSWRGIVEGDPFPTHYRANSASDLRALAEGAGFDVASLALVEGRPVHLRWCWPAYLAGVAYERLVNASERFAPLRAVILARFRRCP